MRQVKNIELQLEQLRKKIDLLYRKKERFTLNKEEEERYKELKIQYFCLRDEMVDIKFENTFLVRLFDNEMKMALKSIQGLVPWNGGLVIREEEFESIIEKEPKLTEEEKRLIEQNLVIIHNGVFEKFQELYDMENMRSFLDDVGKFVSQNKNGNVLDLVRYLDSRYRDFGEILGIELDEVEIEWLNQ